MFERPTQQIGENMEINEHAEIEKYRTEVLDSIRRTKERLAAEAETRNFVDYDDYPFGKIEKSLKVAIANSVSAEYARGIELTFPPAHIPYDFAIGMFDLAKQTGKSPNSLAEQVADEINKESPPFIKSAISSGPFVNLEANREYLYQEVIVKLDELGEGYGSSNINAGKVAVIDYSAPNIAKPIGVGHLRSTIIGQALANIYHETGYSVIKDNHLGDWGTQFGALIYAYQEWGDEGKIEQNPIQELKDLYVKFHQFSEEHPDVKDKARELFSRLEAKDPKLVALWKRFRDLSLTDFDRVYKKLGVSFDTNIGESYFTERADKLVNECVERGICRFDTESKAVVVDEMDELPSFLLRKQDGSSLYLSRDLAALQFRVETFHPDTILYVVGSEQELNFKQLFELGKRADYLPESVKAKHIGFGMVLRDGKKMSTRKGTLIELDDLIAQSTEVSKKILLGKNPSIKKGELDDVSEIIGVGAILYNDLSQSRTTNISFDWDKMLDMEGGSAIYLQYTYTRINSILKKLTEVYGEEKDGYGKLEKGDIKFGGESEFALAKKLMIFPEIIAKAQETDAPHHICTYLEELAALFNNFYNDVSVLKTEEEKLRNSRVKLVKGVATVIKKGLTLLGIKVPKRM